MKLVLWSAMMCMAFASCKKTFEYSPHEIRLSEDEKNLNAKNISKITSQPSKNTFRFIVIGDPQRAYDQLEDFVKEANNLDDISFVLINGDLTDFGLNSEYQWVNRILSKLKVPSIAVIGNHDMLGNGAEVYKAMYGPDNFSFSAYKSKFICLNSNSLEHNYDGSLPDLPWLEKQLSDASSFDNVFVFSHISPFHYGFDTTMSTRYASLLAKSGKVRVSAHAHINWYFHIEHYNDGVEYLVVNSVSKRSYVLLTVSNENFQIEEKTF
jgi:Icc protein